MKIRCRLITLTLLLFGAVSMLSAQEIVVIGGAKYSIHDVAKGETLYSLARAHGVTVDDIIAANPSLKEGLKAGVRIRIPLVAPVAENNKEQERVAESTTAHKVVRGDLYVLAARAYHSKKCGGTVVFPLFSLLCSGRNGCPFVPAKRIFIA
jgi:LysM repeat protein